MSRARDAADIPAELTATTAELNILDGATITTEELNHMEGLTASPEDTSLALAIALG